MRSSGVLFFGVDMKNPFKDLNKREWIIYISSLVVVTASNFVSGKVDIINFLGTIIGVTALIFIAKGNVFGQVLSVIFGVLYSITAIKYKYYSEIITYLGMTAPLAVISIITWFKNPYKKGENVVKIRLLSIKEGFFLIALTSAVTFVFYFVLEYLETPNLIVSTFSIATSFMASYLMVRRISYYAVAFMCNDLVLIVLWVLASFDDITYLSMVACFTAFLVNDLYAFCCWKIRERKQGLIPNKKKSR